MQSYAAIHGGKCVSKKYIDEHSPLEWRCQKGHIWRADFLIIRQGGWCPQCLKEEIRREKEEKRRSFFLEKMKNIALSKGGKCLAEKYINNHTKLKWQCAEGHIWEAKPNNIYIRKSWCPYCSGTAKRTIEELHLKAQQHGGQCLSTKYTNNRTKLKWKCAQGHAWSAAPHNILMGQWCPKCKGQRISEKLRTDISVLKKLAISRGGKLLSVQYFNSVTPLQWECAKGHTWWAKAVNVKNSGHWCPECAGVKKHTIEKMHELAAEKNGNCLSSTYTNGNTKLQWQCAQGHKWMATPAGIIAGNWCTICAGTAKLTIQEMQRTAKQYGGKCLSTTYINVMTKLKWQCSRGHIWMATPNGVRDGHWCAKCHFQRVSAL